MHRDFFNAFFKPFGWHRIGRLGLLWVLLLFCTGPLFLSGCDLPGSKPPVEEGSPEAEGEDTEESEDGEGEGEGEDGEEGESPKKPVVPTPPALTHLNYTLPEDFHPTRLSWTTADGFILQGDLYSPYGEVQALKAPAPPKAAAPAGDEEAEAEAEDAEAPEEEAEAPAKPKTPPPRPVPRFRYPLVVLTHRLSSSGKRVKFLVPEFVKAGYAVLVLDVRGHGISEGLAYGGMKSWRVFDALDWRQLTKDLKQVEQYFRRPELDLAKFPLEVKPKKMTMIAEGISANACLVNAAEQDVHLNAVISIGATLESKKISPILAVMNSHVPILYMASESEEMSYADTQKLFRITESAKALSLFADEGPGMELLRNDVKAQQTAMAWVKRYMPPAEVEPAFQQALKNATMAWAKHKSTPQPIAHTI
jgi:pimeloyl-ACP methyl ester carboxylesterase